MHATEHFAIPAATRHRRSDNDAARRRQQVSFGAQTPQRCQPVRHLSAGLKPVSIGLPKRRGMCQRGGEGEDNDPAAPPVGLAQDVRPAQLID